MKNLVLMLALVLASTGFALINGKETAPLNRPRISAGNSSCSASLIGPRVLISAAHCMRNDGTIRFSYEGVSHTSRCTHHQSYDYVAWKVLDEALLSGVPLKVLEDDVQQGRGILTAEQLRNATADWALCLVDRPVSTAHKFSTLSRDPSDVSVGQVVGLQGFGCTRSGGGGGNDGRYRVGTGRVTDLPSGSDHDITIRGGAALCFGDSGGELANEDVLVTEDYKYIGTNSRGDIRRMSYCPAVFVDTFQQFALAWKAKHGVQICGYDPELGELCRGGKPSVPNSFVLKKPGFTLTGVVDRGYEDRLESFRLEAQRALDAMR